VAEEAALLCAHLEETEVLPVASVRPQAGLAPSDVHGLLAETSKDLADRPPRRERSETPRLTAADGLPETGDLDPGPGEQQSGPPERRAGVAGL
jgi:hypothetical protein